MASVQFSIRMDPAIKAKLDQETALEDRSAAYITQRALEEYFHKKQWFRGLVFEAEAEIDKGEFILHEAVDTWMDSWGTENELPAPKADVYLNTQSK